MNHQEIAIKIENLSKQYRLGVVGTGTLSHDLKRWWTTSVLRKEDPYLKIGETNDRAKKGNSNYVWALKDINLEIQQGDVVGIIGKNGAGKSTLLKILSKVTKPTIGSIKYNGKIASLLEVGTGFHPEMTGRENIYMNGAIMGMSRAEINKKIDEIVVFSGVERYIDTPVKRYSSGMTVRLGFSIAAHLEPDILVVDEVLAVGDAEFQKKAIGKMQDVSKGGERTVLFVSHNMSAIRNLCNTGVFLNNGAVEYVGSANDAISEYLHSNKTSVKYVNNDTIKDLFFKRIEVKNNSHESNSLDFTSEQDVSIEIDIDAQIKIDYTFKVIIRVLNQDKYPLFASETPLSPGKDNYLLTIPKHTLTKGRYSLSCILYKPAIAQYDVVEDCCPFSIVSNTDEFSHLEGFNIGNVYSKTLWQ